MCVTTWSEGDFVSEAHINDSFFFIHTSMTACIHICPCKLFLYVKWACNRLVVLVFAWDLNLHNLW